MQTRLIDMRTLIDSVIETFADKGRLIEGGWISFEKVVLPADASPIQRQEMRKAFFAGAQHLYGALMTILEPDKEPTEKDLRRMELIGKELKKYVAEFGAQHLD